MPQRPDFRNAAGSAAYILEDDRVAREQRNRLEVLQHIDGQVIDGAVEHVRADVAETDGVAVWRGAGRAGDRAVINAIRAHLAEFGIVAPLGRLQGTRRACGVISSRRYPA